MSNQSNSNKPFLGLLSAGSLVLSFAIIALALFTEFPIIIGIIIALVIQVPVQMYVAKARKERRDDY